MNFIICAMQRIDGKDNFIFLFIYNLSELSKYGLEKWREHFVFHAFFWPHDYILHQLQRASDPYCWRRSHTDIIPTAFLLSAHVFNYFIHGNVCMRDFMNGEDQARKLNCWIPSGLGQSPPAYLYLSVLLIVEILLSPILYTQAHTSLLHFTSQPLSVSFLSYALKQHTLFFARGSGVESDAIC